MQLQPYLDRIRYHGGIRPTSDVLAVLLQAHVCAIPFENLDVQLGRLVTIDVAAAYEKIVVNGRGGWCYEQNGLFGWALVQIGFEVTRIAASVMRQERGDVADANHLCLLVRIADSDATYLVDVGFGGSMIQPIELAEAVHHQAPFRLGLTRRPDGYWRFWESISGSEFSFDFVPQPANEAALQSKCAFLQSDPSSGFVLNLVAQLRGSEQHKSLRGRVLSIATPAGIQTRILDSADAIVATLAEHFSLNLPEVADLWPRITTRHDQLEREKALVDTFEIRAHSNNQPLS
jgi:N-hydroxyarylamine O-acetyltransferase